MSLSYPKISNYISWESINIDIHNNQETRQSIFPILCYNVTIHPIQSFITFLLTRQKGKRRFVLPEISIIDEDEILSMSYILRGSQYLEDLIGLSDYSDSKGNCCDPVRTITYAGIYEHCCHHNGHNGTAKTVQYLVYFVSNRREEITLPPCTHTSIINSKQQISAFFTVYELKNNCGSGSGSGSNSPFVICQGVQQLFQENGDLGLYNATDTIYNLPIVVYHCNCQYSNNSVSASSSLPLQSTGSTSSTLNNTLTVLSTINDKNINGRNNGGKGEGRCEGGGRNRKSVLEKMLGTLTLKDKVMSFDMWKTMGPFKEQRYRLTNYYYFFQNIDVCPKCQDAAHLYTRFILLTGNSENSAGSKIITVENVNEIEDSMLQENDIITILLSRKNNENNEIDDVEELPEPLFICTNCERYVRLD